VSATIYTVGHSNRPLEALLELLKASAINALADVRTSPYSRFSPQYNAPNLSAALREVGIAYVPIPTLGGRPEAANLYEPDGRVSYARLSATPAWAAGLDRLVSGAAAWQIAVLCSEEDPAGCHRRLAITPDLTTRGLAVLHLRADGRVQDEAALSAEIAARPASKRAPIEAAQAARVSVHPIRGVHQA
jgi:uncharacterized protein (DUF488 family)